MEKPARAVLNLLGLGARAGALVFGTQAVRDAVRHGKVQLVIVAADAAAGQVGKLVPLLEARGIAYDVIFTREELGSAVGRGPISAVGVTNRSMANRAGELLRGRSRPEDQQGGR